MMQLFARCRSYLKVNQHNKEDVLMTLLEAVNAILPYLDSMLLRV
ncbi:tail tubular protein A [Acinetobacter phage TCUAN2]|nr:tail tubular protein A [Acinetobacter phage TCUAN2]